MKQNLKRNRLDVTNETKQERNQPNASLLTKNIHARALSVREIFCK